jgi:hypothetical protein
MCRTHRHDNGPRGGGALAMAGAAVHRFASFVPFSPRSGRHKKTPPRAVGVNAPGLLTPSPRKASAVESPAGLLACGIYLLSAPSQGSTPQWFLQISFRSQLRGSAGFPPTSLVTGQTPVTARLSFRIQLLRNSTAPLPRLSRTTCVLETGGSPLRAPRQYEPLNLSGLVAMQKRVT